MFNDCLEARFWEEDRIGRGGLRVGKHCVMDVGGDVTWKWNLMGFGVLEVEDGDTRCRRLYTQLSARRERIEDVSSCADTDRCSRWM